MSVLLNTWLMPRVVPRPPLDPASQREQDELLAQFGLYLRAIRNQRDLSLEATAEVAGIHPTYLGEVERGMRNVSLFNIWRIAGALEVPAAALLENLPPRRTRGIR